MPIIYPKATRRKLHSLVLEKVKWKLANKGYKFVREGGFRKEDEPFKYSNYLFFIHPKTKVRIRVGYDFPIIGSKNNIFEICYARRNDGWWTDVTPDFRKKDWREVSEFYQIKESYGSKINT